MEENTIESLPLKHDGSEFSLDDIQNNPEQEEIAYLVLHKLKEWLDFPTQKRLNPKLTFQPLEMTVIGSGGTGKTFLIKVIVSTLKRMFETNSDKVRTTVIAAPTGAAAFNTNGRTCHSKFKISITNPGNGLQNEQLDALQKDLKYTLFLCIDERSMLSQVVLGAIDKHTRYCAKDNKNKNKPFGGIPIVMLTGDDHQLPSVLKNNSGHGAIYCFEKINGKVTNDEQVVRKMGKDAFLRASKTVRKLKTIKRLDKDGTEDLKQILEELRNGGVTQEHAEQLTKLHIRHFLDNRPKLRQLEDEALYLFATNERRKDHNYRRLSELSGEENPICLLKTKYTNNMHYGKGIKEHFSNNDSISSSTIICVGAKVCIQSRNFMPKWGLYNGSLGTVVGIHFEQGTSPTTQDLPSFVVVDFPQYVGPSWLDDQRTYVPIPTISVPCEKKCCLATFIPLCLSFGRTIHTFQGQEAGPTKPIKSLVVDVGSTGFEGRNPGTLYTAISRASTIGNGNPLNSALYFNGELEYSRLTDVRYKRLKGKYKNQEKEEYDKVKFRTNWINHLEKNLDSRKHFTKSQKLSLRHWAMNTTVSHEQLDEILNFHKQS